MNIQRLIDKYEGKRNKNLSFELLQAYIDFIRDLEQLDEPKPVKIPQFVAEKIDYFKKTGDWDLFQAMDYLFGIKEIREWLEDKNNQETFARAWLDGYEVEKEKKYKVVLLNYNDGHLNLVNVRTLGNNIIFFTKRTQFEPRSFELTKNEIISSGFGWVFDCPGIEIEEVE